VSGSTFTSTRYCGLLANPLTQIHVLQAPPAQPKKEEEPLLDLIRALDITGATAVQQSEKSPSPLPLTEEEMKADLKGHAAPPRRKASLMSRVYTMLLRALACGCVGRPQVAA
jgi:hypothetical protein